MACLVGDQERVQSFREGTELLESDNSILYYSGCFICFFFQSSFLFCFSESSICFLIWLYQSITSVFCLSAPLSISASFPFLPCSSIVSQKTTCTIPKLAQAPQLQHCNSEIRISKSQTNSKFECSNDINHP